VLEERDRRKKKGRGSDIKADAFPEGKSGSRKKKRSSSPTGKKKKGSLSSLGGNEKETMDKEGGVTLSHQTRKGGERVTPFFAEKYPHHKKKKGTPPRQPGHPARKTLRTRKIKGIEKKKGSPYRSDSMGGKKKIHHRYLVMRLERKGKRTEKRSQKEKKRKKKKRREKKYVDLLSHTPKKKGGKKRRNEKALSLQPRGSNMESRGEEREKRKTTSE